MDTLEQRLTTDLPAAADAADLTPPEVEDVLAAATGLRRRLRIRTGLLAVAATLVIAGAASVLVTDNPSRTDTADDQPTTTRPDPTTTAPSTTTEQPTTTETTTPSTTTTTAPVVRRRVAESIPLRANSIGAFEFGSPAADAASVTAAINAELGAPVAETPPVAAPGPPCVDVAPDPAWQFSSEAVWPGLTAWFAGPDAASLRLVGYRASNSDLGGRAVSSTPVVRMSNGPTLDDPVATWQAAYGGLMVDRHYDESGGRTFWIDLADGRVDANENLRQDGTLEAWLVDAGAYCGGGD